MTTDDQTEALVSNLEFLGLLSRRKDTATNDMVAAAARYATLSRTEAARERAGELIADRADRTIADLVLATTADVSPVPPCAGCYSPPDDRRVRDEASGETLCYSCAEEIARFRQAEPAPADAWALCQQLRSGWELRLRDGEGQIEKTGTLWRIDGVHEYPSKLHAIGLTSLGIPPDGVYRHVDAVRIDGMHERRFSPERMVQLFGLTQELLDKLSGRRPPEVIAPRLAPGSIWRIGSAGEVKVDACVLDVTGGYGDGRDSAVRFRFRGDLTVRLIALSAVVRRWSYIGMLNQCGAEHSAGHQCQRSVSHDGNHWASLRGSGVQWPQVSFAVYSRAPQALMGAIARLKAEPSSLSTEGTARLVELLSSLRDLVYAAADAAKMGQLSDAVFGGLHDVCRSLLGSVLMVLSGGQPASPWQEKSFLGAIERLMVDGPLYNARLALDERRREARPTTKRKEPKPVRSLVVVDHGWDEPSDWAGSGPGVLGGRS